MTSPQANHNATCVKLRVADTFVIRVCGSEKTDQLSMPKLLLLRFVMTPGKFAGFSKVTRDITDQLRSREFEAEKIAAEKASKAKDDFLAALSHELRTPLTPALAAATYLEDNAEKFPPEFAEDLEIIKRNVQLQARLIDDLLDLTRIARGKLHLELEDCDAHTIIRQRAGNRKLSHGVEKIDDLDRHLRRKSVTSWRTVSGFSKYFGT